MHDSSLPPCAITPDGRQRVVVHPGADGAASIDALATALGFAAGDAVTFDGRVVARGCSLRAGGLRWGARVDTGAAPAGRLPPVGTSGIEWAVVAGPACTPWRSLQAGRSVLGRSPAADLVIDDPASELHHALVDASASASASASARCRHQRR